MAGTSLSTGCFRLAFAGGRASCSIALCFRFVAVGITPTCGRAAGTGWFLRLATAIMSWPGASLHLSSRLRLQRLRSCRGHRNVSVGTQPVLICRVVALAPEAGAERGRRDDNGFASAVRCGAQRGRTRPQAASTCSVARIVAFGAVSNTRRRRMAGFACGVGSGEQQWRDRRWRQWGFFPGNATIDLTKLLSGAGFDRSAVTGVGIPPRCAISYGQSARGRCSEW